MVELTDVRKYNSKIACIWFQVDNGYLNAFSDRIELVQYSVVPL